MPSRFLHGLLSLDLEEKILNGASLVALVAVFMPWISGEWLGGEVVVHTGFGFFTSFLGLATFLIFAGILLVTLLPLIGGPVVLKKKYKEYARFFAALQATILVIASLSVLTKITFEFSRMEVRFGMYVALIASLVTLLYSFLRLQEQRRAAPHEIFHHPDHMHPQQEDDELFEPPPPPPPPPPPAPDEHRLHP